MSNQSEIAWLPDCIHDGERFVSDIAVVSNESGRISRLAPAASVKNAIRLRNRALLPGLVNTHSHAFQRVIRGRTEYRSQSIADSFWTWRAQMYTAANRLSPEDIHVASRMAFLEMALSGITAVGEFHYLHNAIDGSRYNDPNLLAKEVIRAAEEIGIRITLLRVAYARSGHQRAPDPLQTRFIETTPTYLNNLEQLLNEAKSEHVSVGAAPHSVRAVPLDYLKSIFEFAHAQKLPIHMHVAEQPAEVEACIDEYGRTPVELLDAEGLLGANFTAVHAIHVSPTSIAALAARGSSVCACPTTERNLGDGVIPAEAYLTAGVPVSLGTDSNVQIDMFEESRELEYHLRLLRMQRNVLAPENVTGAEVLARRLLECATTNGARALGIDSSGLTSGGRADFFTVDLNDPSIAGSTIEALPANIIFSMSRAAVRDVVVGGKRIVEDGRHRLQDEVIGSFSRLQQRLWQ